MWEIWNGNIFPMESDMIVSPGKFKNNQEQVGMK